MAAMHPDSGLLRQHAAGELDETYRLILDAHLDLCPACLERFRSVSPALPEEMEEADERDFESLWARVEASPYRSGAGAHPDAWKGIPVPRSLRGQLPDPSAWKWAGFWPVRARGVILSKDRREQSVLMLIRLQEGSEVPSHLHLGDESILMLEGCLRTDGIPARAGDWIQTGRGTTHHGQIAVGGECWCMIRIGPPGAVKYLGISWWRNWLDRAADFLERLRDPL